MTSLQSSFNLTKIKAFSCRSRETTAKNCTKKGDARAKLSFWLLNLLFFAVLVAVGVVRS